VCRSGTDFKEEAQLKLPDGKHAKTLAIAPDQYWYHFAFPSSCHTMLFCCRCTSGAKHLLTRDVKSASSQWDVVHLDVKVVKVAVSVTSAGAAEHLLVLTEDGQLMWHRKSLGAYRLLKYPWRTVAVDVQDFSLGSGGHVLLRLKGIPELYTIELK
jgi:hypothetical protein